MHPPTGEEIEQLQRRATRIEDRNAALEEGHDLTRWLAVLALVSSWVLAAAVILRTV